MIVRRTALKKTFNIFDCFVSGQHKKNTQECTAHSIVALSIDFESNLYKFTNLQIYKQHCLLLVLVPSAVSNNVVQIKGHPLLGDQHVHFCLLLGWQQFEQSFGGKTIGGSLLVRACRQVKEQVVSDVEDVLDDAGKVLVEVLVRHVHENFPGRVRDVSFPLQISFAVLNHISKMVLLLHELVEGPPNLKFFSRDSVLSCALQQCFCFVAGVLRRVDLFSHVHCEDDEVEVLLNVVDDLVL